MEEEKEISKNGQEHGKADVGKRIIAAIIDGLIGFIPAFVPVIGGIAASAYLLTKDALPFIIAKNDEWKGKSVGKKLMGLKVVELNGQEIDILVSCKRNITLAIGSISAIFIVLVVIGGPIQLILGIIELILVITDLKGLRLGDRIANTQVVNA